ncbi:unnamed protein product, partial [Choristocarpus tenellus]
MGKEEEGIDIGDGKDRSDEEGEDLKLMQGEVLRKTGMGDLVTLAVDAAGKKLDNEQEKEAESMVEDARVKKAPSVNEPKREEETGAEEEGKGKVMKDNFVLEEGAEAGGGEKEKVLSLVTLTGAEGTGKVSFEEKEKMAFGRDEQVNEPGLGDESLVSSAEGFFAAVKEMQVGGGVAMGGELGPVEGAAPVLPQ